MSSTPNPDPGIEQTLRSEALARAVEAQRGAEEPEQLVARADRILHFLQGEPVEHPGTLVLSGEDVIRIDSAIVRGGLRSDDRGDRTLGGRIVAVLEHQKEQAWEAGA